MKRFNDSRRCEVSCSSENNLPAQDDCILLLCYEWSIRSKLISGTILLSGFFPIIIQSGMAFELNEEHGEGERYERKIVRDRETEIDRETKGFRFTRLCDFLCGNNWKCYSYCVYQLKRKKKICWTHDTNFGAIVFIRFFLASVGFYNVVE